MRKLPGEKRRPSGDSSLTTSRKSTIAKFSIALFAILAISMWLIGHGSFASVLTNVVSLFALMYTVLDEWNTLEDVDECQNVRVEITRLTMAAILLLAYAICIILYTISWIYACGSAVMDEIVDSGVLPMLTTCLLAFFLADRTGAIKELGRKYK